MPITFITGFWGQNFDRLPVQSGPWFWVMIASVAGSFGGMLAYFWRKGWL
jgi:Mg2+ and Co2+ transporter CorA